MDSWQVPYSPGSFWRRSFREMTGVDYLTKRVERGTRYLYRGGDEWVRDTIMRPYLPL